MNREDVRKHGGAYLFLHSFFLIIFLLFVVFFLSPLFIPKNIWETNISVSLFLAVWFAAILPVILLAYPAGKYFRWSQRAFLKKEIRECEMELPKKSYVYEKNALNEWKGLLEKLLEDLEREKKDARRYLFVVGVIAYYVLMVLLLF